MTTQSRHKHLTAWVLLAASAVAIFGCGNGNSTQEDHLFGLTADEEALFLEGFAEMQRATAEEIRLIELIGAIPPLTGDPLGDEEAVAAMHDILLQGMDLEEAVAARFLEAVTLLDGALVRQEQEDGKKKLPDRRIERQHILNKDTAIRNKEREIEREQAELDKKLGFVGAGGSSGVPVHSDLVFALSPDEERDVRASVATLREIVDREDRLLESLAEIPSLSQDSPDPVSVGRLHDFVREGLALEREATTAFVVAVQVHRQAYLRQEEEDAGKKKVLKPEHERIFIDMKTDHLRFLHRAWRREFDEFMKKFGL